MEKSFRTLPDGSCLIETFGWRPLEGVARLDLHLDRLERSAQAFDIRLDLDAIRAKIDAIAGPNAQRCRLIVGLDGRDDLSLAPMPAAATSWNVAISNARLDSGDPLLHHKSSQRALYDSCRQQMARGIDELIFLNERSEVCEGTITNILVKLSATKWLTPPIACGCLPGVFRQHLLDTAQVGEAVLTVADLQEAEEIRLCNSLRGEIRSILIV
ncbi:MAG: aminotransferase class IV family protein [Paracoccaceae bacterium]|jgi:4-amino-4-deoxychorismate lyase|nr:aminotransferase class IV family protein [Paracoccaceae bacterium]